jgi:hypothetical protein
MTRDEWIAQARELLAGIPAASELLSSAPEAATVIEGELVEDDEPTRRVGANRPAPIAVGLARRGTRARPARHGVLARAGRFAARKLTEPDVEAPLYGTERLEVGVHKITERAVEEGLNALSGVKERLPSLSNRGAAFAGRKLGRRSQ